MSGGMAGDTIDLSFVIPVYNEQEVIDRLCERLQETMDVAQKSLGLACEVILIDDGSKDETRDRIESVCAVDARFRGIFLSRNFGHQSALSAGLERARGQAVGVLDGDLQDPPELLLDFHRKLAEGFDVVYAVREKRKESLIKRCCYWMFYRILRSLASIEIPLDSGDFCLMRRTVVDQICAMPERHRFIRGLRSWIGYRQSPFPYERSSREAGKSKYSFSKLALLAADGLLTFSELPLRAATFCGAVVASLSIVWAGYILLWRLTSGPSELAGFATISCGMFFLGSIQLLCLGILGEYVARIHNEVKRRPLYVVENEVGGADNFLTQPAGTEQGRAEPRPADLNAHVLASLAELQVAVRAATERSATEKPGRDLQLRSVPPARGS